MKRLPLLFLAFAISTLSLVNAGAQNPTSYLNDVGSPAYSVTIPVENGFIDVSNGNLHLEFPLASPPQRGALSLNERLVYDSRIWMFSSFGTHGSYHWWPTNVPGSSSTAAGWRFVTSGEVGNVSLIPNGQSSTPCQGDGGQELTEDGGDGGDGGDGLSDTVTSYPILWIDPSGTSHAFNATYKEENNECSGVVSQTTNGGTATDGSGYTVPSDPSGGIRIIDQAGTQVYPTIIDRFGNFWSTDASGNLMDDTGRVPVIVTQNGNVTYYDVSSPNGTINNNGMRVRYTVTSASVNVSTTFLPYWESDIYPWTATLTPVQSILLPDGVSQYTFTYDANAEIASMTLPTGGVITYSYTDFIDSANTENNWVASHTVGSNPAMTFTPTVGTTCANYSTGCKEYINFQKPSGDASIYELTLVNGAWNTGLFAYTGPVPTYSGTIPKGPGTIKPLLFATTAYQYSNACGGPACAGGNYPTESLATTELFTNGSPSEYTQAQSTFDSFSGKPLSVKEWDYSSQVANLNITTPPATTATRETDYTYAGYDLSSVKVLDNNANQAGLTTYSYTTSATTTSGVTGHGTQNAGGPIFKVLRTG